MPRASRMSRDPVGDRAWAGLPKLHSPLGFCVFQIMSVRESKVRTRQCVSAVLTFSPDMIRHGHTADIPAPGANLLPGLPADLGCQRRGISSAPASAPAVGWNTAVFHNCLDRNHQFCFLDMLCKETLKRPVSSDKLADVFDTTRKKVRESLSRGFQESVPMGRYIAVQPETVARITRTVSEPTSPYKDRIYLIYQCLHRYYTDARLSSCVSVTPS
jgi:hypothetical protein